MAGKALQESVGGKLDIKSGLGGLLKKKKRLERRLRDLTVRGYQPIPIKKGARLCAPKTTMRESRSKPPVTAS
jgi:hypothetical protein